MTFFEQQYAARATSRKLLLAFALTIVLLVLAVNGALWLVFGLVSIAWSGPVRLPHYFYAVNTGITLLFVLGGWWMESSMLAQGGLAIAERVGARTLRPQLHDDEHELQQIVQEMALAAQMPVPVVMLFSRQWQINAFAAGLHSADSVIAVTEGALRELDRAELQALVAHELSHIAEGDTRLYTRLSGMVFGLELVFRFGQHLHGMQLSHGNKSNVAALGGRLMGLPVMAAGGLGWLAGRLLVAAVSRQREFLADARAVQWTRYPMGMLGVLRKIQRQQAVAMASGPDNETALFDSDLMVRQQPLIVHMLLVEPAARRGAWMRRLLDSHPPLERRIERLYRYG